MSEDDDAANYDHLFKLLLIGDSAVGKSNTISYETLPIIIPNFLNFFIFFQVVYCSVLQMILLLKVMSVLLVLILKFVL